jgi:hypothetical protein
MTVPKMDSCNGMAYLGKEKGGLSHCGRGDEGRSARFAQGANQ